MASPMPPLAPVTRAWRPAKGGEWFALEEESVM
jgi:hypothetical protein